MILTNKELATINGGGLSATLLNALSRAVSTVFSIGVSIGSSLRRLISGKACRI